MQVAVKAADFFSCEFYGADRSGIERVVRAFADIFAGMPFGAALADQN